MQHLRHAAAGSSGGALSPRRRRLARPLHALAGAIALGVLGGACGGDRGGTGKAPPPGATLFTLLPASVTGIDFENRVPDSQVDNVFTYRNHYNGGGVGIGDLTGDGLPEVVLTSNVEGPRLFLNLGGFRFRDVTREAGLRQGGAWTTGVTIADLDADGRLDLYVSHAGLPRPEGRANELYLNQGTGSDGVPRFVDRAKETGLTDGGYSIQSAVLDYDRDGDLDLFVINNSPRPVASFGLRNTRGIRDPLGGAKLYRNDAGRFTEVGAQAGIYAPEIAFALGVVVADVDRDGWPDVYVANDFFERDYLYRNRGDGTFEEVLESAMPYSSYFSMGLDIADVDDDGWPDIYTTDMLPPGEARLKQLSSFEGWDVYRAKVLNGYHHQFMRNMLQHNGGNGRFHDVGQQAGVAATDWSWSPLLADFDLDGRKDLVVTNGLVKDVTSQDYVSSMANQTAAEAAGRGERVDYLALVKAMRATPIPKAAFRNLGGLRFEDVSAAWGLDRNAFSSGSAYGDLDGDGALDLVINNVDGQAFVFRNDVRRRPSAPGYLQVRLVGEGGNRFGVGARITVWRGREQQVQELSPVRGYQSSVDYALTFGLGAGGPADSVVVAWPDGRTGVVRRPPADTTVTVRQAEAERRPAQAVRAPAPMLRDATAAAGLGWRHVENDFVDFDRDRLIPRMVSTEGPASAVGDVNGDGLDDLFLGGAKEQPGRLLLQRVNGTFAAASPGVFEADAIAEDVGALFFDADGDGDLDLYVVSGGNEFSAEAPALQDRLYLNDGRGGFRKAEGALPIETSAGSRAVASDIDGDGDLDLFVGGRLVPWQYGVAPQSLLLVNDGRGHFTNATARLAPALERVGMVTDAAFTDVDGDGRADLVVVGDWMPVRAFRSLGGGRFAPLAVPGLESSEGCWTRVLATDVDGDGRADLVLGNLGTNGRLRAAPGAPATMLVKDFIGNGFVEQIVAQSRDGKPYPVPMRDDLIKALPFLKARFNDYDSYAGKTLDEVFTPAERAGATVLTASTFSSAVARNLGGGRYALTPLPDEAQRTPLFGLLATDLTGDGIPELLVAGNFFGLKPEYARMEGLDGLVLRRGRDGAFAPVPVRESGFDVRGEVRALHRLRTRAGWRVLAVRNNDAPVVFGPGAGSAK